jgi:hypothetical protein
MPRDTVSRGILGRGGAGPSVRPRTFSQQHARTHAAPPRRIRPAARTGRSRGLRAGLCRCVLAVGHGRWEGNPTRSTSAGLRRGAQGVGARRGTHGVLTGYSRGCAGVLHRDLKPNNLLVNENCDLKVRAWPGRAFVAHLCIREPSGVYMRACACARARARARVCLQAYTCVRACRCADGAECALINRCAVEPVRGVLRASRDPLVRVRLHARRSPRKPRALRVLA